MNLLRVLDESRPTPVATVLDRLQRSLQVSGPREAMDLLSALCALISFAREKHGDAPDAPIQPFLNVKVHVWIREFRRMVCSVHEDAHDADVHCAGPSEVDTGQEAQNTADRPKGVTDTTEALPHDALTATDPIRRLRYSDDLGAADCYRAAALLAEDRAGANFTAVIVDEAQDMIAPAWRLIRSIAPEGQDDLFIVGDAHQRIY